MNSWYVSSAAYAAIPQFAISHAYTVGNIVRSLATPSANNKGVFRCTTAGTSAGSEAGWSLNNNATTTQGGAVFTTVTGQSAYGWGAAAGDFNSVTNAGSGGGFAAVGDTIFLSSDHVESVSGLTVSSQFLGGTAWGGATTFVISVNRGGSVPPVAGDITSGASFTASSSNLLVDTFTPTYYEGLTLAATGGHVVFNSNGYQSAYLKNCAVQLNGNNSSYKILTSAAVKLMLDNTTVQFANAGQGFSSTYSLIDLTWINTPSALLGTMPTALFLQSSQPHLEVTCRGVDLSALTGTLVSSASSSGGVKALLDSCKIASGVTAYGGTAPLTGADVVELINCYDGTNTRNERYTASGSVVTERTITLATASGGAVDDIGGFSLKFVSNSNHIDPWAFPLEGFWLDVENTAVGSSHTATVEIVSSASLNNDDISLMLEYQGTSGSPVASFGWSMPVTPLTAHATVTTSAATWNSSPSTPVYQKLQVTFTPQVAGRVRGLVRLGKPSTTVYVNPVITIT